jgi:hypothetical protein
MVYENYHYDTNCRLNDPGGDMHAVILRRLSALLILVCTFFMLANLTAFAVDASKPTSNVLDGMKFVGETGEEGKKANNPDTISFEGGVFRSSSCEVLGFGPAPYSVVKQGDTYKFSATLVSSDTGTLEWQGTIIGNTADATFRWKHKRWFWTIDRDYWYKGTGPSSQQ